MVAPVLLASCLNQAGISATAIDFNIYLLKKFNNHPLWPEYKNFLSIGASSTFSFSRTFFKEIIRSTKEFLYRVREDCNPTVIGLSIFSSESLDFGLVLSYCIRRYLPDVKIIAGGKGLEVRSIDGEMICNTWVKNAVVDTAVVGDAEQSIASVVAGDLFGVVDSPPQTKEDLDTIPLAQWGDYNIADYTEFIELRDKTSADHEFALPITASKGCVRKCTFCDVASFWPKYIYRDPLKVADEIEFNFRKTGINRFFFTDNLINGSISNYRAMNQHLLTKMPPKTIKYSGYAIFRGATQMPDEDFELAANAGCSRWHIGVESGSERIRKEMKKNFSNCDLDWSVRRLLKYGISQNWLLMVGYPSETEEDFTETLKMLREYSSLASNGMITVQVTPTFMVLQNSPLIMNPTLSRFYGLDKKQVLSEFGSKFWVSSMNPSNDYPTRSRRWKDTINEIINLGYQFGPSMPISKWVAEVNNLDRIYEESRIKVFPILRGN